MPTTAQSRVDEAILAALQARMAIDASRKEKTRQAASLLFFEHGIYPSAKVVLSYTQQGSLTDINRDLQEFWQSIRERSRVQIDAPFLPQELVTGFGEGLAKLWALAVERAQGELEALRQEAASVATQAQREMQEAERMRQIAVDAAVAVEIELRQERGRRESAEKCVEAQAAEIKAQQVALGQWQHQAESEAQARQDAERQFSRDLEAERVDRQREAERFIGESRFAKLQIEQARSAEREAREQFKSVSASKDVEISMYRQRAGRAEEALGVAKLEIAEFRAGAAEALGRVRLDLAQEQARNQSLEARLVEMRQRGNAAQQNRQLTRAPSKRVQRRSLR